MTNKEAIEILRTFREAMDTPITNYRDILLGSLDMAIESLEQRPQGEWIETEPTREDIEEGFVDFRIVCSKCGNPNSHYDFDEYHKPKSITYYRTNFCPYCGAKMRKGGAA